MESSSLPVVAPQAAKEVEDTHSPGLSIDISSVSTDFKASPPMQSASSQSSNHKSSHRHSFVESLRNVPPSPRHRHPSFTQAAIQDLLNHPPSANKHANPKFAGREWQNITIGELVSSEDVRWIDMDSSVEEATMVRLVRQIETCWHNVIIALTDYLFQLLLKSPASVVLIREDANTKVPSSSFDYNDLNAYLLVVIGLSRPDGQQMSIYNEIRTKAQQGAKISLREIQPLCCKEALINLSSEGNLSQAIELLGSGIHRILVNSQDDEIIGIMSQLRMVDFFWNEGVNFPTIDRLYPAMLRDLGIGTQHAICIK